jgi:hypothetical protein
MSQRDSLQQYLRALEGRLRWLTWSRGLAIAAGVALLATVTLVLITNALAFSARSLFWARCALFVALACATAFGIIWPLWRLNARRAARRAEQQFPQFEERLLTFVEARDGGPFVELLAEETAALAREAAPARIAPARRIAALAGTGAVAAGVLGWLVLAGPGYLGYGASLLWAGAPRGVTGAFYDIEVQPGDKIVRRRTDQTVTARLKGFQAQRARLFAKYRGASKWEQALMLPEPSGAAHEFVFAALPESVEYYVEAGGVRSKTYTLTVKDLPAVKRLRVTYQFPSWLALPAAVEDPGGDLRAVAGTVAELAIEFDRPLERGVIVLEDGRRIDLAGSGTRFTARVPVEKDGAYHVAALEQNQAVRLSEDYFIEAKEDKEPVIRIARPGRDAKVSPVEEVTVEVEAEDEYGLNELNLVYSVNGGEEKKVPLLGRKGEKSAAGRHLIALEEYRLEPGDVVSLYATARDARSTAQTSMYFLEAQPFEKEYSQGQQQGGGGMQGEEDDSSQIGRRQKEIIVATSAELRSKDPKAQAENAKFLSEMQAKLRDQARTLAERARARQLSGTNAEFQTFVKEMEAAAKSMDEAAPKLAARDWKGALPPEQKALQHLLRAEAVFRQIQVAFGQQGGGSGAARDLDNLFDLELDKEKNQFETGQQSSAEQRQKEVDEALQRLEELARRQQQLAEQQKRENRQAQEQRWQQEMLRREAEELQKKLEQLSQQAQNQSGQQNQAGQQSQSGQQSQAGQQSQSGQQSRQGQQALNRQQTAGERRLQEAFDRLKQATEDMRRAADANQQPSGSDAATRRAAERLNEARDMLSGLRRQEAAEQLNGIEQRAAQLAGQQKDFEKRLREAYGDAFDQQGRPRPMPGMNREQAERFAAEKDQMKAELDRLEKEMKQAMRDMAGSQPKASAKLRDALGELQQQELRLRMEFNSQAIRRGQGPYVVSRERPITQGLESVRDQARAAREALGEAQQAQQGRQQIERALTQVEKLREQLARASGQQQGQPADQRPGQQGEQGQQAGQQPGQQQPGQQQGGQQPGQTGQPGQQGERGQQTPAGGAFGRGGLMERGPLREGFGGRIGDGPVPAAAVRDAARDLQELRRSLADNPELQKAVAEALTELQRLNLGATRDAELDERIRRVALPNIEQLELLLRRKLDEERAGQVRAGAAEKAPPGYADAVAEYFRRLSRKK